MSENFPKSKYPFVLIHRTDGTVRFVPDTAAGAMIANHGCPIADTGDPERVAMQMGMAAQEQIDAGWEWNGTAKWSFASDGQPIIALLLDRTYPEAERVDGPSNPVVEADDADVDDDALRFGRELLEQVPKGKGLFEAPFVSINSTVILWKLTDEPTRVEDQTDHDHLLALLGMFEQSPPSREDQRARVGGRALPLGMQEIVDAANKHVADQSH